MEMGQEVVVTAVTAPARMGAPPPTSLAPGFRFHPTDEELVKYYLRRKVCGKPCRFEAVAEIDVYKSEPWELGEYSALKTRDLEWYFFTLVDKKYGNGSRVNRATTKGYWKATGKDRSVHHNNQTIGLKKTLVFHTGRAPDGTRTNWVMHEYRLCDSELQSAGVSQDAFVLCRIFQKSGLGPPTGNRYAPFVEEEWNEDAAVVIPGGDVDDDVATADEAPGGSTDLDQDTLPLSIAPPENPIESNIIIPYMSNRDVSEEPEIEPPLDLSQSKRSKHDHPNSSHANGSEDSITMSQDPAPSVMMTKNVFVPPLEFPFLESFGSKENPPANPSTFDSSTLENSVPAGYLKFINNLEDKILDISMEKETLKLEVMRTRATIDILQSRVDILIRENQDLRRRV